MRRQSGAEPSQTLYQHITDILFNQKTLYNTITAYTRHMHTNIEYNEKNALHYVSGYMTRTLYCRLEDSKHQFKDNYLYV